MKFPTLEIENFLAITSAKMNLADRGLVLIQGVNDNNTSSTSNGAGKSSIVDALCWCWYGITARNVTGDDVINRTAGKGTSVTSTIQDGPILYTATRYRKHKTGKNSLALKMHDGLRETDLTKGTDKLTQEVADKIIGASLDVFTGAIYAGQEKMPDLPAMTDKALKMMIEEAAGVTILEAAYEQARSDMRVVSTEVDTAQQLVQRLTEKMNDLDADLKVAETGKIDWFADRETRVQTLKEEVQKEIIPDLRGAMAKIAAIDRAKIDAEIAACQAKIAAVSGEQDELAKYERAVTTFENAIDNATNRVEGSERLLAAMQKAHAEVVHKLGCPCDECGRPLTEAELDSATDAAALKVTDAHAELERNLKDLEEAKTALEAAVEARDAAKLSLTDVSVVSAQQSALAAQVREYDALLSQQTLLTSQARNFKEKITNAVAEENPYEKNIGVLKARLEQIDKDQKEAVLKLDALYKKLEIENEVVKIYGPAGVRARILDEVTPFLNAQTSKYLSTLTDGTIDAVWSTVTPDAKGNLKEKFTIDVTSVNDAGKFAGFSGGEKRKIRVAAALALQDLVATRASKPIDLFIGDEIDDALDPAGIERLTLILEEKAKERGSVFIISHNEISDHVSNVMTIRKTATGTVITETAA